MTVYEFDAFFDEEARVWVAHSDMAAVATEADTKEALAAKVNVIVPDVLHARAELGQEVPKDFSVRINWRAAAGR